MNYYCLNAQLMSCLMVQENRQTNSPQGLPYLPGSTLRGAIAAQYLREFGTAQDSDFKKLFIENPIFFPDLLPTCRPDCISFVLPATACSCKRSPGFCTAESPNQEKGHGVDDMLAVAAAAKIENRPMSQACDVCKQDMKPFNGFWNGKPTQPEKSEPMFVYQRHTGIDRHTGTISPSIFYITQGIAQSQRDNDLMNYPQYLTGGMFLNDEQSELLSKFLTTPLFTGGHYTNQVGEERTDIAGVHVEESYTNGMIIFAGADRTRGMGEMFISLKPAQPDKPSEFNLGDWNKRFREKISKLTTPRTIPEGVYFSIGLTGDAILVDRFLRPSCELTLDFPEISEVTRIIRKHVIRGWQSSWKLPKPEDTAVAMGGVYLFQYTGKDKDIDGLETFLKQLTTTGIGLRRPEGFGRIQVCNPLHIQEKLI